MTSNLSGPAAAEAPDLPTVEGVGAASPQSAGAYLRAAREKSGLHIAALAVMLKVPQAKLEAIEGDRWQDLPDMTFVRALAKAMCRALKVDAGPVMAMLPSSEDRVLSVSRGLNTPYRDRSSDGFSLELLGRPVVLGAGGLLVAAAVVFFMPADWLQNLSAKTQPALEAPVASVPEAAAASAASQDLAPVVAGASALPASQEASAPGLVNAPASAPAALNAVAANTAAVNAAPVAAKPAQGATPTASAPVPAPVPGVGQVPLRVKITDESWVEVVDAKGQVLLSKLLRPGDEQNLVGTPPLKIRVGNVAGTELTLRGSAVDLKSQSRDNVARIELN
nr:RodZ domain-containing protein [uncultured Roseateles sp.]